EKCIPCADLPTGIHPLPLDKNTYWVYTIGYFSYLVSRMLEKYENKIKSHVYNTAGKLSVQLAYLYA
ncbi:hypothetical protein COY16_04250, partial [Candidatus Roizmanbacteria bacterium CG_4_10_14_0_2_um_filter_39_13]